MKQSHCGVWFVGRCLSAEISWAHTWWATLRRNHSAAKSATTCTRTACTLPPTCSHTHKQVGYSVFLCHLFAQTSFARQLSISNLLKWSKGGGAGLAIWSQTSPAVWLSETSLAPVPLPKIARLKGVTSTQQTKTSQKCHHWGKFAVLQVVKRSLTNVICVRIALRTWSTWHNTCGLTQVI